MHREGLRVNRQRYDQKSPQSTICFTFSLKDLLPLLISPSFRERDIAQWLERGALPMSLPVVRFRIPLGAGFSEKYHVSLLSILENC